MTGWLSWAMHCIRALMCRLRGSRRSQRDQSKARISNGSGFVLCALQQQRFCQRCGAGLQKQVKPKNLGQLAQSKHSNSHNMQVCEATTPWRTYVRAVDFPVRQSG